MPVRRTRIPSPTRPHTDGHCPRCRGDGPFGDWHSGRTVTSAELQLEDRNRRLICLGCGYQFMLFSEQVP